MNHEDGPVSSTEPEPSDSFLTNTYFNSESTRSANNIVTA